MIFFKEPQKNSYLTSVTRSVPLTRWGLRTGRFSGPYLQASGTQACPDMLCRAQIFGGEYMERGYASVCVSVCLREIVLIWNIIFFLKW